MRSFRDAPEQGNQGRCGKSVNDSAPLATSSSSDSGARRTHCQSGDRARGAFDLTFMTLTSEQPGVLRVGSRALAPRRPDRRRQRRVRDRAGYGRRDL